MFKEVADLLTTDFIEHTCSIEWLNKIYNNTMIGPTDNEKVTKSRDKVVHKMKNTMKFTMFKCR